MDVDWFIDIRAEVADENRNRLPSDRQMMGYDEWGFVPGPPTSAWPENAYVLVGVNVAAEAVPYALHLSLFRRKWQPQPIPETEETRPTSSEFSDRALERVQFGRTITLSVNDPADQSQPAFLRNAGFDEWEDGMPVGWAARDAYREKFVERVSDEVHGTVLRTNPGHHWTLYQQIVPVYGLVAGKTIRLHARALSHDGRVRVMLNIDGKQVLGPSHPGDGRWRTIWVEYEVPNDFKKTEFTIGATLDGPPQSHILLDDFAIAIK